MATWYLTDQSKFESEKLDKIFAKQSAKKVFEANVWKIFQHFHAACVYKMKKTNSVKENLFFSFVLKETEMSWGAIEIIWILLL
jgi:hypothetical protein